MARVSVATPLTAGSAEKRPYRMRSAIRWPVKVRVVPAQIAIASPADTTATAVSRRLLCRAVAAGSRMPRNRGRRSRITYPRLIGRAGDVRAGRRPER